MTTPPTAVPPPLSLSVDGIGAIADTITKATLAAAAVVAVVVILLGMGRAIRERLRQQLVISDTEPLPEAIVGSKGEAATLSPWLRQQVQSALVDETAEARGIVEEVFRRDVRLHRLPTEIAIGDDTEAIASAARDTMVTVASGLRAVAPDQAEGILGALGSALPKARGCQVRTMPMLRGDEGSYRLGLAIELHDLNGLPIASTTLWEPGPKAGDPAPGALSGLSWQERLVNLIDPAAHWVALRLVSQRLRATPARSLTRPVFGRRRSVATQLGLQRLLAAALTLNAMREFKEHAIAFGSEAVDDLDQVGSALDTYHRPAAIRGAVQELVGFAYRREEGVEAKARRAFLDASASWGVAEDRLATNPGQKIDTVTQGELDDERERHRVRRLKCALLSGDPAAIALAAEELRENPPRANGDARTLYSIACLYSSAAARVEETFLAMAWGYLGRSVLAATEELIWERAREDDELAALVERGRFLDDLSRTWSTRRAKKAPPLLGADAEVVVLAALERMKQQAKQVAAAAVAAAGPAATAAAPAATTEPAATTAPAAPAATDPAPIAPAATDPASSVPPAAPTPPTQRSQ